jgi:hypothetical protein
MKEQDFTRGSNKNICFVANFEKTFVFDKVADQLSLTDANIQIFWIVVNSKLYSYLKAKNKIANILYLPKNIDSSIENIKVEDCNVNEIVNHDRFLSLNSVEGINYLNKIKKHIYGFLKNNNIAHVFGESTWGHELLISRICNYNHELYCQYHSPQIVRLPQDRFAFFNNESENIIREGCLDYQKLSYPTVVLEKQEYINKIANEVRDSVSLNQRLKRVKKFITKENIFKDDPTTLNNFVRRFEIGFKDEWNKTVYRFVKKHKFVDLPPLKKYLYTLHVQPEASIDVLGRYYSSQYTNILHLWKNMPEETILMVKEHRTGIGNRSFSFYREISKLKNVFLISENEDPHSLIRESEAVFTVSGTIAYEAALIGKPSFTFAPVFFNNLVNCHKIDLEDLVKCKNLSELIKEKAIDNKLKMDIELFSKFLYHHTYKGSWSPESLDTFSESNVKLLAVGVLSLLNSAK